MTQSAYQYSLYLLSGQDYSAFKLRQKLRLKEFAPAEIDETIAKLQEKNYLREGEYKRLLARRWIAKGYSDTMIQRRGSQEELTFTREELTEWREDMGQGSGESIARLVEKKLRGREIPADREGRMKLREKVCRYLIARGHGYDEVKRAVDAAMA